ATAKGFDIAIAEKHVSNAIHTAGGKGVLDAGGFIAIAYCAVSAADAPTTARKIANRVDAANALFLAGTVRDFVKTTTFPREAEYRVLSRLHRPRKWLALVNGDITSTTSEIRSCARCTGEDFLQLIDGHIAHVAQYNGWIFAINNENHRNPAEVNSAKG